MFAKKVLKGVNFAANVGIVQFFARNHLLEWNILIDSWASLALNPNQVYFYVCKV